MSSIDLDPFLNDIRVLERFWAKVAIADPRTCWLWTGARKPPYGYGQFVLKRDVYVTASRFALATKVGALPSRIQACHSCDNPPCCNPAHLFPGTQSENNRDCISKGRGNRSRGEAHRDAKLTEEIVVQLRAMPFTDEVRKEMAQAYGVNKHAIYMAQTGRTWKHVGTA